MHNEAYSCDVIFSRRKCLLLEFSVLGILSEFLGFLFKSLSEVPLEISIGSAVVLTFIWIANEIFGRLSLWRTVLVTVWGLIGFNYFAPVQDLSKEQIWLAILVIGAVTTIVGRAVHSRLAKRKRQLCSHCGAEITAPLYVSKKLDQPAKT
jgi:hypothetical protein